MILLSLPFIVLSHMTLMLSGSVAMNSISPWVSKFSTSSLRFRMFIVSAPARLAMLKRVAAATSRASSALFMWVCSCQLLIRVVPAASSMCRHGMKITFVWCAPILSAVARGAMRRCFWFRSATALASRHHKTVSRVCQAGRTPGCVDRCGSSGLHLVGTVDDVCGDASVGEAAVVDAVVVVEAQVGVEFSAQVAQARVEVARERGAPALVEDGLDRTPVVGPPRVRVGGPTNGGRSQVTLSNRQTRGQEGADTQRSYLGLACAYVGMVPAAARSRL